MIVDCHVNIYDPEHMLPLYAQQSAIARPGGFALESDCETIYAAMQEVDKAIIFSNRKKSVSELNRTLKRRRLNASDIHGDLDQAQRQAE